MGSVQSLSTLRRIWDILYRIMRRWFLEIGIFFAGGAFYFLVHRGVSSTDFILGAILSVITIYLWTESYRWCYWKDVHYNESNGTATTPPPENLIKLLMTRIKGI